MVGSASIVLRGIQNSRPLTEAEAAFVVAVFGGALIAALVLLIPVFRDKPVDFHETLLALWRAKNQKKIKSKGLLFWRKNRKL